jgi:HEAT repeat protein
MEAKEPILKHIEELKSSEEKIAFRAIGELKRTGKMAVPSLIQALMEPGSLRTMAIVVLGEIGKDASDAIPALTGLLKEDHKETQMAAALSLTRIGKESLPGLIEVAKESTGQSCFWAAWAISLIDPAHVDRRMVDLLNQQREQPSSMFVSLAAEEALGKIIASGLGREEG